MKAELSVSPGRVADVQELTVTRRSTTPAPRRCGSTPCADRATCAAAVSSRGVILDDLRRGVPALHHPVREAPPLPTSLGPLSHPRIDTAVRKLGRLELGTLGRGNHFLELQADDTGALWLMVHSGSRAMGQLIREHHLGGATARGEGMCGLDADSAAGLA